MIERLGILLSFSSSDAQAGTNEEGTGEGRGEEGKEGMFGMPPRGGGGWHGDVSASDGRRRLYLSSVTGSPRPSPGSATPSAIMISMEAESCLEAALECGPSCSLSGGRGGGGGLSTVIPDQVGERSLFRRP